MNIYIYTVYIWVVDVSMCPMVCWQNVKKYNKPQTLKINLSHAICNSKNEATFFSCYLYVKFFFYIFAISHHRTQSNFYLSTTHIYIYIYCIYMKSSFAKTDKHHFKKNELSAVHYSPHIVRSEP